MQAAGVSKTKNRIRGAGNTAGPNSTKGADGHGKASTHPSSAAAGNSSIGVVGRVSLKHVYEIAKIKQGETRLSGLPLEGLVKSVIAQAGSIGVLVVP